MSFFPLNIKSPKAFHTKRTKSDMHTAERGRPLAEMIYGNDSIKFEGNSDDSSREARKIREATDTKDGKRATKNLPLCRTSFSVN